VCQTIKYNRKYKHTKKETRQKTGKIGKGKPQIKTESNQSWSDRSKGQDNKARYEVDQTEDGRLSRDKSINNQA
jgi:hypothetical protein